MNDEKKGIAGLFRKLLNNKILVNSSFLAIASVIGGVVNFVFNLIVVRVIPDQYGIVYPFTSLLLIIGIPAKAFQFVLTHDLSDLIKKDALGALKIYFRKISWFILIFTLILAVVLIALIPLLKRFLHVEQGSSFLIVIASVFFSTLMIPYFSLVQSRERFFIAGFSQIVSYIAKFGIGIGIVVVFKNYFGVLWGIFAGSVALFLVLFIDYLFYSRKIKTDQPLQETDPYYLQPLRSRKIASTFFYAIISYGAFQLITYLDPILVRHFLKDQSGVYSTVNLLGKASFFIATAFSFVMLPMMAKDKENLHNTNRKGLLLLIGVLIAYALFLTLFSRPISIHLLGNPYPGMEKLLPIYAFMFIPYAAISYLVNYYFVSKNIVYSITILIGAVLLSVGILVFHDNLYQVSYVVGAIGYAVLGVLLLDSLIIKKVKQENTPNETEEEQS